MLGKVRMDDFKNLFRQMVTDSADGRLRFGKQIGTCKRLLHRQRDHDIVDPACQMSEDFVLSLREIRKSIDD